MIDDKEGVPKLSGISKKKFKPRRDPEEVRKHAESNKRWYLKTAEVRRRKSLEWAQANPTHRKAYMKKWREENIEKLDKESVERYAKNKERIKKEVQEWRKKNADRVKAYRKQWYAGKGKKYRAARKEKVAARERAYRKEYAKKNRVKMNENARRYVAEKRIKNLNFKILTTIRNRLMGCLRSKKQDRTLVLLGCDIPFLKNYLEARFKPGMTWENHGKGEGKWHVDHIKPCASFDFTDHAQQKICFHYTNLQPLWGYLNLRKSDYVVEDF